MLALKGATLVPRTVQLSFCLEPSWKIPMKRGPNGKYMSQWVDWQGQKNGECRSKAPAGKLWLVGNRINGARKDSWMV